MVREIEVSGNSKEEAIELAKTKLNYQEGEEIEVEVIEEGTTGFLGFGARETRFKVKIFEDVVSKIRTYLEKIMEVGNIHGKLMFQREDRNINIKIEGDDVAVLIGRRGQTMNALQYLLNIIANRISKNKVNIIVDVSGYRKIRKNSLHRLAGKLAEKVKKSGKNIELEPMFPYERKVIHLALKDDDSVYTYSKGEEPYRKVVISTREKEKAVNV